MTYKQLFQLAEFISSNEVKATFVNLSEDLNLSYHEAFGCFDLVFEHMQAIGLYVVIYPESEIDMEWIMNNIKKWCKDIEYTSSIIQTINDDGLDMIIIGVDESK